MKRTIRGALVAAALVCASVVIAPASFAAPPNAGPVTIADYGFESPADSFVQNAAYPNYILSEAPTSWYWGRTLMDHYGASGTGSFWCAGTPVTDGTPSTWPTYSAGTRGEAGTEFANLDDYYSVSVSMKYKMASKGPDDWFALIWRQYEVAGPPHSEIYIPVSATWQTFTQDLSGISAEAKLSRVRGSINLGFYDHTDFGSTNETGTGALVDDFTVSGYRYGPIRSVSLASPAEGRVDLSWPVPYTAVGSSVDDTRTIEYRIWRANAGTDIWTELTAGGRAVTNSFPDMTVSPGAQYKYVVQAWDPGIGEGRGQQSPIAPWPPLATRLDIPSAPVSVETISSFQSVGTLLPAHAPGLTAVQIQCSTNQSTIATTFAGVMDPDGTTYRGTVRLSTPGTWYIRARHQDAGHSETLSDWRQITVMLPQATLGAPSKPSGSIFMWLKSTSSGSIVPAHAAATSVLIECSRNRNDIKYTYSANVAAGATTYSASNVKLPIAGTWYLRAHHVDSTHRDSYSSTWTTVTVSGFVKVYAPAVRTTMYRNRTYTVAGYIIPRHASTYLRVYAYRWNGRSYAYSRSFAVRVTNSGQPEDRTKYLASVKLPYKGYWKLRVKHSAHSGEPLKYSPYSSRIRVK